MKRLTLSLLASLTLLASLPTYALPKAAMDRCTADNKPLTKEDRAIVIYRSMIGSSVFVTAYDRGVTQRLGETHTGRLAELQPVLRQWASGGLTVVYVATAVASGVVYGLSALAAATTETAGGAALAYQGIGLFAGAELALGSAFQFLDVLNPVAQFERANSEKCLVKQAMQFNHTGETLVIRMNDKDDYEDTKEQLTDLLNDLK